MMQNPTHSAVCTKHHDCRRFIPPLAHAALQLQVHQLIDFLCELQRQLIENLAAEAGHDDPNGALRSDAALLHVKQLLLRNARRAGLVLDLRLVLPHFDVRVRVGLGGGPDQHRVALAVVARRLRVGPHLHQPPVHIAALAGGDALADDARARVFSDVDHLGAGVGLLHVVGEGHGVELPLGPIALQHARGVLPRDGGPGLDLGPRDLGPIAVAQATLGHEIVDSSFALFVPGVPILHRRVLDLSVLACPQLHDGRVQLVLVVGRGSAALEVRHV
mmetsp:Transcript_88006/g.146352  ORF Transcript_88006/g.146352 Transcript_88006/m.146352 type:complete len:275 (+) Transcript_88006:801-1625(+)